MHFSFINCQIDKWDKQNKMQKSIYVYNSHVTSYVLFIRRKNTIVMWTDRNDTS